ncbi:MAG: hypothetical protein LW626_05635, partial [Verrucomicrobium sp.]|nr:hypothetical protein [Verrucomicrobium sp.]
MPGFDLEEPPGLLVAGPEEGEQPRQAHDQHHEQDRADPPAGRRLVHEVGDHHGVARDPQPGRKRRDDAAAVEKTDRGQVEEVEQEARVGQCRPERIARRHVDQEAHGRAEGPEDRAADAHHRLDPGVSRGVLQRDERPHERDEDRGAHPEALAARRDQVTEFVDEDQHDEAEGELPPPQEGIGPDAEDHGAAGLEEVRQELQERQQG